MTIMAIIRKSQKALVAALWFWVSFVLSFASGWLLRKMVRGNISPDDKAALFVLLATVLTLVIVLCTVGIRRWKLGVLSPMDKRLMVFSLVMHPLFLVLGWFTDIG